MMPDALPNSAATWRSISATFLPIAKRGHAAVEHVHDRVLLGLVVDASRVQDTLHDWLLRLVNAYYNAAHANAAAASDTARGSTSKRSRFIT